MGGKKNTKTLGMEDFLMKMKELKSKCIKQPLPQIHKEGQVFTVAWTFKNTGENQWPNNVHFK